MQTISIEIPELEKLEDVGLYFSDDLRNTILAEANELS